MDNLINIVDNSVKGHSISYNEEGGRARVLIDGRRTDITLPNFDIETEETKRGFAEEQLIKILVDKITKHIKEEL